MNYSWRSDSQVSYYFRETDGRILGSVWQYVNNNTIWCSKILADEFPFTNSSDKHIGHYITQDSAKKSVEMYWLKEERTLLEEH